MVVSFGLAFSIRLSSRLLARSVPCRRGAAHFDGGVSVEQRAAEKKYYPSRVPLQSSLGGGLMSEVYVPPPTSRHALHTCMCVCCV